MPRLQPTTDPYRVLGVLRGATPAQIKAAHRRLAKRFHPDGSTADELRFLAVQEAYQLLSDPARRRDWDRAHAPGPVRAAGARRPATGTPPRGRSPGPARRGSAVGRAHRRHDHALGRRSMCPGGRISGLANDPVRRPRSPLRTPRSVPDDDDPNDFDVFNRSSGAAWSAAARRHFRRGTDDLPSRGVWRYRGTQVVTGAEARKVAAEEEEKPPR